MKHLIIKDIKLHLNLKKMCLTGLVFAMVFFFFSFAFKDYMAEKRTIDGISIGIIDLEDSLTSQALISSFENDKDFTSLFRIEKDPELIRDLYEANELTAVLTIPNGFSVSLLNYENKALHIALNPSHTLKSTIVENTFNHFTSYIQYVDSATYSVFKTLSNLEDFTGDVGQINDFFSMNMIFKALGRNSVFAHNTISTFPSSNSTDYFLASVITLITLSLGAYSTSIFAHELNNYTLQRLYVSGTKLFYIIGSKIAVYLIQGLYYLSLILLVAWIVNPTISIEASVALVILTITALLFFISFASLVGLYFKEGNTLINNSVVLLLCIIGGNFFPLQLMPKYIENIAMFTPNYWIIKAILYAIARVESTLFFSVSGLLLVAALVNMGLLSMVLRRRISD